MVAACLDLLRLRHWWPARLQAGTFKTPDDRWVKMHAAGTPDYAALHEIYPGFLVEFKRPGGTRSPDQIQKHQELAIGYRLTVATVASTEELIAWLDNYEGKARQRWQECGSKSSDPNPERRL